MCVCRCLKAVVCVQMLELLVEKCLLCCEGGVVCVCTCLKAVVCV